MKRILAIALLGVGLLLAVGSAQADAVDFTAVASAPVSDPGTTIGWSYSITNNTGTDLEVVNLDAGNFQSTSGFINISSLFDYPFVPALSTVAQSYDPITNFTGLAEFTWFSTAPLGTVESGFFTITLDSVDANGNDLGFFGFANAPFSISTTPNNVPVPEPRSIVMLTLGLAALLLLQRSLKTA
jgi:hypothetical protein